MSTEHERVIQALATVPEKKLLIIDLASELVTETGVLNYDLASEKTPEINLAVAEARLYAKATVTAIHALRAIPARGQATTSARDDLDLIEQRDEDLGWYDENQEQLMAMVTDRAAQLGR